MRIKSSWRGAHEFPSKKGNATCPASALLSAFLLGAALLLAINLRAAEEEEDRGLPVPNVIDPGVITTRQAITPAGVQSIFEGRVHGVAFGLSSHDVRVIVKSNRGTTILELDWQKNRVEQMVRLPAQPGMQSITFDATGGRSLITVVASATEQGKKVEVVRLLAFKNGQTKVLADNLGYNAVGGSAISVVPTPASPASGPRHAVIPLTFEDRLAIVDLTTGSVLPTAKTGIAPFGAVVYAADTFAYVSNWGGRFPEKGDRTAPTGLEPTADQVVVDARGVAASGTVSGVDLRTGAVTASIPVGLHPTSLAWDETRHLLYVANSNSDSISVIDTQENRLLETIQLQPFDRAVAGIAPEALVLAKDGRRLYAACAGINAVAVVQTGAKLRRTDRVIGLIPTGWYPNHLALSPDGQYLAVSTLLGVGSGAKNPPSRILIYLKELGLPSTPNLRHRYVHAYRGTVHVIAIPNEAQLEGYTQAVAENNRLRPRLGPVATMTPSAPAANGPPMPVPMRAGQPSPIKHVVYIIKENRSYDQLFGGLGTGNGDPSLQLYGENAIPNHRNLARQYVTLDNFYATGGNSGDGHQWVTQASETDYTYWPGYRGRSYPGGGIDPLAYANSGFIWDAVLAGHKTFVDFGEFAPSMTDIRDDVRPKLLTEYKEGNGFFGRFLVEASPIASLRPHVVPDYPSWAMGVPDVVRARIFLRHLQEWENGGEMPSLVMIKLPSDHTLGTTPGFSTPAACMADNDLALGQIIAGLSHSKFWPSLVILVVEDDAQNGIDHVDGHRTVALAVGPYVRRGAVDSTFYSQPSILKTIEKILGLPNLSIFDLIANDMRNSFRAEPDLTPYDFVVPQQSIYELNPPAAALSGPARAAAIASAKMDFSVEDAAPTQRLNEILWHQEKGWLVKYPKPPQAVFAPYARDLDDDERAERGI